MAAVPLRQIRDDLIRLAHRDADVDEFSQAAARVLCRAVPFDGVCMVTLDPVTSLPTSEFVRGGLPEETRGRMAEIEGGGEDYTPFRALAESDLAATLSRATGGDLERSVRHRELKAPHGFGDELRVALVDDDAVWGGLTLLRRDDRPPFTDDDTGTVASLIRPLTVGLRRSLLLTDGLLVELSEDAPAGVAIVDADNAIVSSDPVADAWLDEIAPGSRRTVVPSLVGAVAARARADRLQPAADVTGPAAARARIRTGHGRWFVVRASVLGVDPDSLVAVAIEPARPRDLAPLVADAFDLTPRERAVTRLVAEGHSTRAIGERLYLSAWTVQDHLKAIFEKVGVGTRGELVARVFFGRGAPRL